MMTAWEDNIYYHPENSDLEIVGSISWVDAAYEFDLTVVWRDSTGMFYWGSDAGCSCPSPFEYATKESMARGSAHDVADALRERLDYYRTEAIESNYHQGCIDYAGPQVVELIGKVLR